MTRVEADAFVRHRALEGFGAAGQDALARARVAVVGAGGLGCPAALYLAAAGVGRLTLIDSDRVSVTNLHRQVLFGPEDVGRPKVEAAAEALARLAPGTEVTALDARLGADAPAVLEGHDLILDCTDTWPSRLTVNDAAVALGVPLVWGAVQGWFGQVTVFDEGRTLRDVFPHEPPQDLGASRLREIAHEVHFAGAGHRPERGDDRARPQATAQVRQVLFVRIRRDGDDSPVAAQCEDGAAVSIPADRPGPHRGATQRSRRLGGPCRVEQRGRRACVDRLPRAVEDAVVNAMVAGHGMLQVVPMPLGRVTGLCAAECLAQRLGHDLKFVEIQQLEVGPDRTRDQPRTDRKRRTDRQTDDERDPQRERPRAAMACLTGHRGGPACNPCHARSG